MQLAERIALCKRGQSCRPRYGTQYVRFSARGLPVRNTSKITQPPFLPVIFQRGKPPARRIERHDHEQPHAIDAE